MNRPPSRILPLAISLAGLTLMAGAADSSSRSGPAAAREQLAAMTVPEGLEVTLFASEPQIVNPSDMEIDARGRVWITEGANYRRWSNTRPDGDRIVILEDTNGDGAADVAKTFYQGPEINTALGICVLGNKVIVSCSPKIMVFTDANGDDKADGPPQVLFSGLGGVQHDHGATPFFLVRTASSTSISAMKAANSEPPMAASLRERGSQGSEFGHSHHRIAHRPRWETRRDFGGEASGQ